MIAALNPQYAEALAGGLISWSWQALLLLSCVWLLCRMMRSRGAWLRHNIWLCGLIAVVLLPLWSGIFARLRVTRLEGTATISPLVNLPATVGLTPVAEPQETSAGFSQARRPQHGNRISFAYTLLCILWVGGVIIASAKMCVEALRMRRARRRSRPFTFTEIGCPQLQWTRPTAALLALSPEVRTPILSGIICPMILIPADITEWTSPQERGWMLEHEMAHLLRRDNLIVILQALLGIIFFFHPLVRYALNQLSLERELACDDLVVHGGASSLLYAESLLKAAGRSMPSQAVTARVPFASRKSLQKRIDNIMNTDHSLKPFRSLVCLALTAALLLAVASLLGCARAGRIGCEEQEVREFLQEIAEAEISNDPETFNRLTAPEFIRIGAEGKAWNKEQTLDVVRQGRSFSVEALDVSDEQIRIYGDTAVVTALGVARGHNRTGQEFVQGNLCTIVLVKRDGRWQCVSVQQTRRV